MRDGLTAAALLTLSNTFMTMAWYGHLRFKTAPLLLVIVTSWGIAFFEYLAPRFLRTASATACCRATSSR